MRTVRYRRGRGSATEKARGNLNELVMLMEAAVALANVERWVQESVSAAARAKNGPSILTDDVRQAGKRDSYEVSVVDSFMRLGAVSFAAHGSEAVWERAFRLATPGRPVSVDVCLFNSQLNEEARLEFGKYTVEKLKKDSRKLYDLLRYDQPHRVANYVMLWRTRETGVAVSDVRWRNTCVADAEKATTATFRVRMEVVSEQEMFGAKAGEGRKVQVALFSVTPRELG